MLTLERAAAQIVSPRALGVIAGRLCFPQGHERAPPLVARKAFGQVSPQNNVPCPVMGNQSSPGIDNTSSVGCARGSRLARLFDRGGYTCGGPRVTGSRLVRLLYRGV